jgi:acyl dehydratase
MSITPDRVADFVEVTGDQADRWLDAAPPGFAAAALFVVAPELLDEMTGHAVIHGEQTFIWHGAMPIGSRLRITGQVSRFRERGGVNYVGFDLRADGNDGPVVAGSSLFLVTGTSPPAAANGVGPEPRHSDRGNPGASQRGASRADLVRYAAATGDWNPVHWDHDAAVAAGLPGVVVHGLFQAAWAFVEASRLRHGPSPLASAKVRFRHPLPPAHPVSLNCVTTAEDETTVTISDGEHDYLVASVELRGE